MAFKIDKLEKEKLEKKAREQGKRLSDLLNEGFFAMKSVDGYESKLAGIERENKELKQRLERITGKKPKLVKRVSIGMTLEEYDKLSKLAEQNGMTKTTLLRSMLVSHKPSRMLPLNG